MNCYCEEINVHWHLSPPLGWGQKETPRKMENQKLVSPLRQCSSTPVSFGQGFLSKEQCEKPEASPILSWLVSSWFLLVHGLKSALKGQCICDTNDIIKNTMNELKRLLQNGFQDCFYHPDRSWQKCIFAQGDLFERNVVPMIIEFCISRKWGDSENILKLRRIEV